MLVDLCNFLTFSFGNFLLCPRFCHLCIMIYILLNIFLYGLRSIMNLKKSSTFEMAGRQYTYAVIVIKKSQVVLN